MSAFKDMVAEDIHGIFLNDDEFAERRTIKYDGEVYQDIPIVLTGLKEKDRQPKVDDHAPGLYLVSSILHCSLDDLNGNQPEQGAKIWINDEEGGGGFFRRYYIASSDCEMGMVRCGLEAIDE